LGIEIFHSIIFHFAINLQTGATLRIIRILHTDQDLVERFLDILASGLTVASQSRSARPGFFVFAANFIEEYLEPVYFKKEDVLLSALEDYGFSPDEGPVGTMRGGNRKSREISKTLSEAARQWLNGDEDSRIEAIWAASEYTGVMHRHMELLKNLIHPLLEQSLSLEDEQKAAEHLNVIAFEDINADSLDKYTKMVKALEEEVSEWKKSY
jgi:hemerythrin-like domain-containing protein